MLDKFNELKQVYIPCTNVDVPITNEDKISLEKGITKSKLLLLILPVLFIISLPMASLLPYEMYTGNDIFLIIGIDINDTLKAFVWVLGMFFGGLIIFCSPVFFLHNIEMIKNNKKILESKKINVIKGVVSDYTGYGFQFYIAGDDYQSFKSRKMKNSKTWYCDAGMFIEIRYNPYTIRRIDDNLYDVNFIAENESLSYIKEYENLLLELQEELNNTNPKNKKKIDDLNESIGLTEVFLEHSKEKLSELPKKINYPIKRKTNAIDMIIWTAMFGLALGLISIILLVLTINDISIVSTRAALYLMLIGITIASVAGLVALGFRQDRN